MIRRSSRGMFWDALDKITSFGLQISGIAFGLTTVYLAWGIATGYLVSTHLLSIEEQRKVVENIILAGHVVAVSGILVMLFAGTRYYLDEVTGYALFVVGAAFRWGVPMLMEPAIVQGSPAASIPAYIAAQYTMVGTIAIVFSVPFICADFWRKLDRGGQRKPSRDVGMVFPEEEELPKSRVTIFCWQMPFCREYLRKHCSAYTKRKSCWRIKSGCYCDEDMIIRVMKRSATSKLPGFKQLYTSVAGEEKKGLTAAQKRARCRRCFIYQEHQNLKYRILSPLTILLGIGIMWLYFEPVRASLSRTLSLTDEFASRLAFSGTREAALGTQWATAQSTSVFVEWLFLVCLTLFLITYLIRALEYCIFELKI